MNENKIDKKIKTYGLVLGIVLFVLLIAGFTYAALNWKSSNIVISGNTECLDIESTKGSDITGEELLLLDESSIINGNKITIKEGMVVTNVTAKIKSGCTINGYMTLNLNVTSLNSAFTSSGNSTGALKYVVATYDPTTYPTVNASTLKDKSFDMDLNANFLNPHSVTSTGTIKLKEKQLSTSETVSYLIIFYIDGNLADNDAANINDNFTTSITVDVNQGSIPTGTVTENVNAVDFITNLYTNASKSTVTNNGITYNYATSVALMNDRLGSMSTGIDAGSIRYYGASPNNYIYFNCDDYSNQTSSTCEAWRIIGVFDGKVKIMRNESIGSYSWDNKGTSSGAEDDYGKNNWSDARLMKMLNAGYESETGGSLYWNRQSGTCYSMQPANSTYTCDFTISGLKNDITRNMISETTYSLLGWKNGNIYSDQIYNYERTTGSVYNETTRDKSWTGKIALAYPSDYGYAADLNQCSQILHNYNNSTCKSNDWMFNSAAQWLLTPNSGLSYTVWHVNSIGFVNSSDLAYHAKDVRPVLYLGSELEIKSGDGSNSTPYQLSV